MGALGLSPIISRAFPRCWCRVLAQPLFHSQGPHALVLDVLCVAMTQTYVGELGCGVGREDRGPGIAQGKQSWCFANRVLLPPLRPGGD